MKKTPQVKIGYAKKQAKAEPNLNFLTEEDNRRCIKVYDEEDVPRKRQREAKEIPKSTVQTIIPQSDSQIEGPMFDKLQDCIKKLTAVFNITENNKELQDILQPKSSEQLEKLENDAENPNESAQELLNRFVQDLDKATKLTVNQIKVVESYGIAYEVDHWKYEPRITGKNDRKFERRNKDFKRTRNYQRPTKIFEEINHEDIFNEIPEKIRPKFYPVRYAIKNIDVGFSLKALVITQRNNDIIINE